MKKGDFAEIEFTGKIADTGDIFDLTSAEEARKAGIFNEKHRYGPVLVIIGAGMTIPGVEDQVEKMNPGEEKEFDVEPGRAFGTRIQKLVKVISMGKFLAKNINPVPGIFVDIDGHQARIRSVSGGRVLADFNHPLAGKKLHYNLKIVRHIKGTLEKAKVLLDHYGLKAEPVVDNEKITLKTDKPLEKRVQEVVEHTIKEWIKEIRTVSFSSKTQEKPAPSEPMEKV